MQSTAVSFILNCLLGERAGKGLVFFDLKFISAPKYTILRKMRKSEGPDRLVIRARERQEGSYRHKIRIISTDRTTD
jgi:hypothetical protein